MSDFCNRSTPPCAFNSDNCLQFSEPSAKLSTPNSNSAATNQVCVNCPVEVKTCLDPCAYSPTIRIVITITTLRNPDGASADQILAQHNAMCPDEQLSAEEVDSILSGGRRRGVFLGLGNGGWLVKADFAMLPSNLKLLEEVGGNYLRCLDLIC